MPRPIHNPSDGMRVRHQLQCVLTDALNVAGLTQRMARGATRLASFRAPDRPPLFDASGIAGSLRRNSLDVVVFQCSRYRRYSRCPLKRLGRIAISTLGIPQSVTDGTRSSRMPIDPTFNTRRLLRGTPLKAVPRPNTPELPLGLERLVAPKWR
jgi:hypothetical protein